MVDKPRDPERRNYVKAVGGLVVGLAVGGAAGWLANPAKVEVMGPEKTVTQTVTQTVTGTPTPTPTPTPTGKPYAGTELAFSMWLGRELEAIMKTVPRFTEKTGITIKNASVPVGELVSKFKTSFVAKSHTFDVVSLLQFWNGSFYKTGDVIPLDPYIERDRQEIGFEDFFPSMIEWEKWQGQLYGLPFQTGALVVMVNKDHMAESGVAPEDLNTYEGMFEAAEKMNTSEHKGIAVYGKGVEAFAGLLQWVEWLWAHDGEFIQEVDGKFLPAFNTDVGAEGVKYWQDIAEFSTPPAETDNDTSANAFFLGKLSICYNWTDAFITAENPEESTVVGRSHFMAPPLGVDKKAIWATAWSLSIPSDSLNQDAAWEWIKWVVSKEIQIETVTTGVVVPGKASPYSDPDLLAKYSFWKDVPKWFANSRSIPNGAAQPVFGQIYDTATIEMSKMFSKEVSITDGLTAAEEKITELLKDEGLLATR